MKYDDGEILASPTLRSRPLFAQRSASIMSPADFGESHTSSLFSRFFFFKQKTAYEIMPSLVGSEMCIRDSNCDRWNNDTGFLLMTNINPSCLLYTSDAADDLLCVDLGGRRIIKKKKKKK